MRKLWTVYAWHGLNSDLSAKLAEYCDWDDETDSYVFEGSIDEFLENHGDNVLVMVEAGILGVTHKKNFNQC